MRFCQYCGAPLEDGQQCTCPQAQQKQREQSQPQPEGWSQPTPPQQPQQPVSQPQQSEQQGYGYGQAGPTQPGYGYQQTGADSQQPGYRYQQPGPGNQQPGYGYQQQPGYGYQQQPGGQSSQQAQQFAQVGKQMRDTTVHAAKSLKPFFTQYWTSPIQAVRTAVAEKNLTLAVTLTVIRVLVVIALLWSMVGKVADDVRSTWVGALGALSSMLGSSAAMTVKHNPLGSIVFGLLIAVLGMALFTLLLFGLTRIFKSGGSILDMYIANSANGGVTTVILLLAFVCSLFSLGLGLGLVVLACFSAVLCGGLSAQVVCGDQNSGTFWLCYLAGVAVILLVSWWLVPVLVVQAVGGITLSMNGESVTIRQVIKQLKDVGLSNILSGLFSNMLY